MFESGVNYLFLFFSVERLFIHGCESFLFEKGWVKLNCNVCMKRHRLYTTNHSTNNQWRGFTKTAFV